MVTITEMAAKLSRETGIDPETARRALGADDPGIVKLAESLIHLGETRAGWHAEMARHRANILRSGR